MSFRVVIGWFLLCAAGMFGLMAAAGDCKSGGIVYCYGDSRDYWWHPSKVIFSLLFALLLPLSHIFIALFYKTKRNFVTIFSISKKWHRAFGLIMTGLVVLGFASSQLMNSSGQRATIANANDLKVFGPEFCQPYYAGTCINTDVIHAKNPNGMYKYQKGIETFEDCTKDQTSDGRFAMCSMLFHWEEQSPSKRIKMCNSSVREEYRKTVLSEYAVGLYMNVWDCK